MKTHLPLLTIIIILTGFATPGKAQVQPSATNIALAEQLVGLMHLDQGVNTTMSGMKQIMAKNVDSSMGTNASPESKAMIQKSMDSSTSAAASLMSAQNMKEMYVSVYAGMFTTEELQGAIDFYKTPVGQKWVEKQPQVAMAVMAKSMAMMPQIMAAMRKSMDAPSKMTNAPASVPAQISSTPPSAGATN